MPNGAGDDDPRGPWATGQRLEAHVAILSEQLGELRGENRELRTENASLRIENAALRAEMSTWRKEVEQWRRGHRERGKRRSSASEKKGKEHGRAKRPGRKAGHEAAQRPVPDRIDGEVEHPMPVQCECGGPVEETDERVETVVQDIPPVQVQNTRHSTPVGCCTRCGKRVVAPLPGATAQGRSIAQVQLGPNLQAMIVGLRFEQQTSYGAIQHFLRTWMGLDISRGGLSQLVCRLGERALPSYTKVAERVRNSEVVGLDETGLHQNGVPGYVWLARTPQASLFRVELSRGGWVFDAMMPSDFAGVVCSDFYSVYTARKKLTHGYCGAHVIRDVKKFAEVDPCEVSENFRDEILAWYAEAREVQQAGDPKAIRGQSVRLGQLIAHYGCTDHPDVLGMCGRLKQHFAGVVYFVGHPEVPWHNNDTERDIRPLATYRKVTGGTRSPRGSLAVGVWMTITQTLRKNGRSLSDFVSGLYNAHWYDASPPDVFAPG